MKLARYLLVGLTLAALLAPARETAAHPIGNFSINRYTRIELFVDHVRLHYVVDMAEIPTLTEQAKLDRNHDGEVSDEEHSSYLSRRAEQLLKGLSFTFDGVPLPFLVSNSGIEFQPGVAGLRTMRLTLVLTSALAVPAGRPTSLIYEDDNFTAHVGWGEIVLKTGREIKVLGSTASDQDLSNELRNYPASMVDRPPDTRRAEATVLAMAVEGAGDQDAGAEPSWRPNWAVNPFAGLPAAIGVRLSSLPDMAGSLANQVQSFAALAAAGNLDRLGIVLALALATLWGAAHALSPGHGKTVVGVYLVGSRGTPWHALYLGLTVTATHTLGVYFLAAVTLLAARFMAPESLYHWLAVLSSLGVLLVGAVLAVTRLRGVHLGQEHAGGHEHAHSHPLLEHGEPASHRNHDRDGSPLRGTGYQATGEADGNPQHHHEPTFVEHPNPGHGHLLKQETVGWRSLLALGVAGGLLPCPSALVLFLGALGLGQVVFGLVLVVAFSLGLAVVLTAVGILFVYAKRLAVLPGSKETARTPLMLRLVPLASALFITAVGLTMTVEALGQAGFLLPR